MSSLVPKALVDIDKLFRLDGQVALVTGASSGIGRRFAEVLDAAGASVCLVARREERLKDLAARLGRADIVVADMEDPDSMSRIVEQVVDRHGRLDLLVNNAGTTKIVPAIREDIEDIRRVFDVNVLSPYVLAQAAARVMRDMGGGTIVNVASINAFVSDRAIPEASYAASKGAVASLTRELAVQWARYDIRVNALAPGMFATEMTDGLTTDKGALDDFEETVPLKRVGRVDELDAAILFLCSPANTYLTGELLVIDGGVSRV